MKTVGTLQGKTGRRQGMAVVLGLTLALTASAVASPIVKRENAAGGKSATAARSSWNQMGTASWYGPGFNGRATATGETYDMYAMTCAHRTLPLGSWIRVTNLHNKRIVFLRVNDRGPMSPRFIVDLSYKAAQKLGIQGIGKVKIEVVSPKDGLAATQLVAQLPMSNDPTVLLPASWPEAGLGGMASVVELR